MEKYKNITEKERLSVKSNSRTRAFRYRVANKYIKKIDVVLDVGCGSEYGRRTIHCKKYIGVDKYKESKADIIADLNNWQPTFDFDVFVALEVIEHIKNTENFIKIAKKAKREIIISCPASETMSFNKYHLYDFTPDDIDKLFIDDKWILAKRRIRGCRYGKQQINRFIIKNKNYV